MKYFFLNQTLHLLPPRPLLMKKNNNNRKFQLPKLELRKFDGDISNWIQFWSQFEKIDSDPDIDSADKFQYLIQATVEGSRAREIVESFPPSGKNYKNAITSLKSRFGRSDLLVELYTRNLLRLVLKNASKERNQLSIGHLYDKLEAHIRALETLDVTTEKCALMLYPLVESCMPEDFLKTWQRSANYTIATTGKDTEERLQNLMAFLKAEVEAEERIDLAKRGFEIFDAINVKIGKSNKNEDNGIFTSSCLLNATCHEQCVFCNKKKPNSSHLCYKARSIDLKSKKKMLKQAGCCYRCLKLGHKFKKCRVFIKCNLCSKAHSTSMCKNNNISMEIRCKRAELSSVSQNKEIRQVEKQDECPQREKYKIEEDKHKRQKMRKFNRTENYYFRGNVDKSRILEKEEMGNFKDKILNKNGHERRNWK